MAKEITVQEGQNIFDVVVQNFGNLDNLFTIFASNASLTINTDLTPLSKLIIDDSVNFEKGVVNYFITSNFITNNADNNFVAAIDQKQFEDGEPFDFEDGEPFKFN